MQESVFIIGMIYGLYLIFLAIIGILLGFLLGVYNRDDEIYVFLLLRLLKIFYNNRFYFNVLFEYLDDLSLESKIVEQFSKLSLKTVEQIQQRPLKIILKKPDTRSQIKLPILGDPFLNIDIDFNFDESTHCEFKLFKSYRNGNPKIKS